MIGSRFPAPPNWPGWRRRCISDFIVRHLHATQGLPRPAEAIYPLPEVHGGQQIALCYRGDLYELLEGISVWEDVADDVADEVHEAQEELEDFIADWYWDAASHEFAWHIGQFLFAFLDDLEAEGLSERTYDKHVINCWLIGKFTCDLGTMRPSRQGFSCASRPTSSSLSAR